MIYREFFPVGLTAFDPLDEARLGLKGNLAHVMARSEVRDLMRDIGVLPSEEKLDFESRVNLIVSELRLPPVTLLGQPAQAKSPATS